MTGEHPAEFVEEFGDAVPTESVLASVVEKQVPLEPPRCEAPDGSERAQSRCYPTRCGRVRRNPHGWTEHHMSEDRILTV